MDGNGDFGARRVLVVINEPVDGGTLCQAIGDDSRQARVHLVAPAFGARRRTWRGERATAAAERRLYRCLSELEGAGVEATGNVGDAEPIQAIEDSLREFAAEEIVIASNPARLGRRLGANFAERVVERFRLPFAHLAVGQALTA